MDKPTVKISINVMDTFHLSIDCVTDDDFAIAREYLEQAERKQRDALSQATKRLWDQVDALKD